MTTLTADARGHSHALPTSRLTVRRACSSVAAPPYGALEEPRVRTSLSCEPNRAPRLGISSRGAPLCVPAQRMGRATAGTALLYIAGLSVPQHGPSRGSSAR
jgi:hypothetical protein